MPKTTKLKSASTQQVVNALKTVGKGNIPILPIDPETYMIEHDLRYVPYYKPGADGKGVEFEIFRAHENATKVLGIQDKLPCILVGPTGTGKTLSVAAYHRAEGIPLLQADCSEGTKKTDLIGRFVILDGTVWYQLGILPTGLMVANQSKTGRAGIDLEEVNGLSPAMQKVVNQFLDWRGHVYIPEIQKVFTLDPGKSLMIYATMNPSSYGGTHELNRDFKNRFVPLKFKYPTPQQEFDILEHDGIDDKIVKSLTQMSLELRVSNGAGDLDTSPSPRTNQMFCNALRVYQQNDVLKDRALKLALQHVILNQYESPQQQETVANRMQRSFGVNMSDTKMDDD